MLYHKLKKKIQVSYFFYTSIFTCFIWIKKIVPILLIRSIYRYDSLHILSLQILLYINRSHPSLNTISDMFLQLLLIDALKSFSFSFVSYLHFPRVLQHFMYDYNEKDSQSAREKAFPKRRNFQNKRWTAAPQIIIARAFNQVSLSEAECSLPQSPRLLSSNLRYAETDTSAREGRPFARMNIFDPDKKQICTENNTIYI